MFYGKKQITILCVLLAMAGIASATGTRTYTVTNLQRVASNAKSCDALYHDLKNLTKNPVAFEFTSQTGKGAFTATEKTNTLKNHNYTIAKQDINGNIVNRVGMGSFEINNRKVDYVVQISADIGQDTFKYIYPIMMTSEQGHCSYTASIQPDTNTIAVFKKHIQNGNVANSADLSST